MPSAKQNTIPVMNWNERITIARNHLAITKSEFSRRVGVSTATTTDWESGKIRMIDGRNLVKAAEVLKVTPEWIMTGRGGKDASAAEIEFTWVYRHVSDRGRDYLRDSVAGAKAVYLEAGAKEA